jgi:hypothetical protein
MLQAEHDLFHRHAALAEDTGRIEQDQARQQAQDQVAIVGVFPLDLPRLRGQQVLQQAEMVVNPAPPFPGPDYTGRRERRRLTEQRVALVARLVDDDHRDRPRGGAGGGEPHLAAPGPLEAVTPGPVGPVPQLLACDPRPVGPWEDGGALPLHHTAPVLMAGHLGPHLRVSKPAISHHQRRGQLPAPSLDGRPRPVQPHRPPGQLGAAGPAGTRWVRPAPREGHGHDQLALAAHHHQPQAIDPAPDPRLLTTPPGADQPELVPGLLDEAVVAHPGPWPPTPGGRALVLDMRPQGGQQILRPARQLSHPRVLRPGAQDLPGQVLVPAADSGQLVGRPAPKHGGEHDPKDVSPQLPQRLQPPLDRDDQGLWQPQVDPRRFPGLQVALRARLLVSQPLSELLKAALGGLVV